MGRKRKDSDNALGPQHIRNILETVLQETGLGEQLRENRAVVLWSEVAGDEIAPYSRAVTVEKGTLWVEIDHPARIHRLQMEEAALKERINLALKAENTRAGTIRQIRFRLMGSS
jgi:predicted nucleic acid-binding Zn ribbon protein